MANFSVEIQGKAELDRTLLAMAKCLPNNKVEPVLMEGAKIIRDAARDAAPQYTGRLRKEIVTKTMKSWSNFPRSALAKVQQGPYEAPHAKWIEFGTTLRRYPKKSKVLVSKEGKFYGRSVGPIPKKPFWKPTVQSVFSSMAEHVKGKFLNMITEAMR